MNRFLHSLSLGLGAIIVVASSAAALADPAIATRNMNVRAGPGTEFPVVDSLRRGERIDVIGCRRGWCFIEHRGPDGWVSGRYLAQTRYPSRPNFQFYFNFGRPPIFIPPGMGMGMGMGPPDDDNGMGMGMGMGPPDDDDDNGMGMGMGMGMGPPDDDDGRPGMGMGPPCQPFPSCLY